MILMTNSNGIIHGLLLGYRPIIYNKRTILEIFSSLPFPLCLMVLCFLWWPGDPHILGVLMTVVFIGDQTLKSVVFVHMWLHTWFGSAAGWPCAKVSRITFWHCPAGRFWTEFVAWSERQALCPVYCRGEYLIFSPLLSSWAVFAKVLWIDNVLLFSGTYYSQNNWTTVDLFTFLLMDTWIVLSLGLWGKASLPGLPCA